MTLNRRARRIRDAIYRRLRLQTIDLRTHTLGTLSETVSGHPHCYARSLRSCQGNVSREHFISENLLEHFESISPAGVPWLTHVTGNLPTAALVAKTLCRGHNSFLSPLDAMAGILFTELKDFSRDTPKRVIVPGRRLERFFLKVLFGLLSTNQFEHQGRRYTTDDLGDDWVKVLFGISEFPDGTGLYIHYEPGGRIDIGNRLTAAPVFLDAVLGGLQIEIGGFRFLLSLFPKERAFKQDHPSYGWIMFHPNAFNKEPFPQEIRFEW